MRIGIVVVLSLSLLTTYARADDQPETTSQAAASFDAAETPAPDDTPSDPATATPAKKPRRTEGLIPGILVGPKVSATLLFPPNVMVGAEVKVGGWVGASFEYGVYPGHETVEDYELDLETWSAGLRVFPFRSNFFVGAVFGKYSLTGTENLSGISDSSMLEIEGTYLGPQIGWKWDFDVGLFLGLNLGYGFALDYSSDLTQLAGVTDGDLADAKENADRYLKSGVPILTLLELGWLF
jgi:hypothetical protein